jgi:UDP-glucose 4-epimerase
MAAPPAAGGSDRVGGLAFAMATPRVLVTGASGFIGRALVAALRARNLEVTGMDLQPFPDRSIECVIGDLTDVHLVRSLSQRPFDVIFHLAARTSVVQSKADPDGVYANNVAATQALLEACRQRGIPSFVFASTNAVVGNSAEPFLSEKSVLRPLTPYGATKAAAEMLCFAYGQSYGMAIASVRLTNVYGPGMSRKDSLIIRLMRAAVSGAAVKIYGDGRQIRDYVYVDDAVAGLMLAWDRKHQGPLVIGSGRSVDVHEVHQLACAATGVEIAVEGSPPVGGEMRAVRVDLSLARSIGYTPRHDLASGLSLTWRALRPELSATHSEA